MRVGIVTNLYPSSRNPDLGTFIEDLVIHLERASVDVMVIKHSKNYAAMSLECSLRSFEVDLFDAQFLAPAGVITSISPRLSPYVVTVHRWDIYEFPYRWPLARTAACVALTRAKGIVAVGQAVSSEVRKFVPHTAKVVIIPNAVDSERFRPRADTCLIKRRLEIPEDYKVILSVGHLVPRKGFHVLIRAMSYIVRDFPLCALVIVGGGPQRQALEELGRRLGLEQKLRFVGRVEGPLLPSYYAMADVFVMPSFSEGHCVSILEAMSMAKPIVASSIAGNLESVRHGRNGFLVSPNDSAALASATISLLEDENLNKNFGLHSREIAVKEFGWEHRIRRLVDFYGSVL